MMTATKERDPSTARYDAIIPAGEPWICQFDTAQDTRESRSLGHALDYRLDASSVALLEC